jgi:hypothetical protein
MMPPGAPLPEMVRTGPLVVRMGALVVRAGAGAGAAAAGAAGCGSGAGGLWESCGVQGHEPLRRAARGSGGARGKGRWWALAGAGGRRVLQRCAVCGCRWAMLIEAEGHLCSPAAAIPLLLCCFGAQQAASGRLGRALPGGAAALVCLEPGVPGVWVIALCSSGCCPATALQRHATGRQRPAAHLVLLFCPPGGAERESRHLIDFGGRQCGAARSWGGHRQARGPAPAHCCRPSSAGTPRRRRRLSCLDGDLQRPAGRRERASAAAVRLPPCTLCSCPATAPSRGAGAAARNRRHIHRG